MYNIFQGNDPNWEVVFECARGFFDERHAAKIHQESLRSRYTIHGCHFVDRTWLRGYRLQGSEDATRIIHDHEYVTLYKSAIIRYECRSTSIITWNDAIRLCPCIQVYSVQWKEAMHHGGLHQEYWSM